MYIRLLIKWICSKVEKERREIEGNRWYNKRGRKGRKGVQGGRKNWRDDTQGRRKEKAERGRAKRRGQRSHVTQ